MKKTNQRLIFLGALAGALLLPGFASGQVKTNFYVRADVGGTVTEDTTLKEFFGPVAPGTKVKFDPGIRVGLVAGYQLTDWFAGEFETGVMANNIESISGADVDNASFSNVPLLVNAVFRLPGASRFVPYLGGGVGGAAASLNSDHITIGGTTLDGGMSTMVFAYQAFAGIRYRINDRMGINLAYHYFGTSDPDWKASATSGTASEHMQFTSMETHAASIAFEFRF